MSQGKYRGFYFARRPGEKWPRLSLELTELRHPEHCQSCGTHEGDLPDSLLARWKEHDDLDRPEDTLVVLCPDCARSLIESHPRLYDRLDEHAPWAGCMPICVGCRFRGGLDCTHPDAKANGGGGVALTMPAPFTAFWDGRGGPRGGRRCGGVMTRYGGPVTACAQRDTGDADLARGSSLAPRAVQ